MTDVSLYARAERVAGALNALPDDWTDSDVIDLFEPGEWELFDLMDRLPGHWVFDRYRSEGTPYGLWAIRLRQVRNGTNGLYLRLGGQAARCPVW